MAGLIWETLARFLISESSVNSTRPAPRKRGAANVSVALPQPHFPLKPQQKGPLYVYILRATPTAAGPSVDMQSEIRSTGRKVDQFTSRQEDSKQVEGGRIVTACLPILDIAIDF